MIEWTFSRYNDFLGFDVPKAFSPEVSGGVLKLCHVARDQQNDESSIKERCMIYPQKPLYFQSPQQLNVPLDHGLTVSLRMRNLSPETDGRLMLVLADGNLLTAPIAMVPYQTTYQTIQAVFQPIGHGLADHVRFSFLSLGQCGYVEINKITLCLASMEAVRQDRRLTEQMPRISMPVVTQLTFTQAFETLEKCLYENITVAGVSEPFFAPGGRYGPCWWQLDNALAAMGAKWIDQTLSERVILGLIQAQNQNPDGRIDLYGWAPIRGTAGDISSLPKFIYAAYDIALSSHDRSFVKETYLAMTRYLDWWLSPVKRDEKTGLITSVFEETFPPDNWQPQRYAPVDLNVEVAVGCQNTARLASIILDQSGANKYGLLFRELKHSINTYLWDKKRKAYFTYDIQKNKHCKQLICSTFDVLRNRIASPERTRYLIDLLTDPNKFGWGKLPVTSVARTDDTFIQYEEETYSAPAWSGDIWTLRNEAITTGLTDSGEFNLAAHLAWDTIQLVNGNYREFFSSRDGKGYGVIDYAWTASQFIHLLVHTIFGISCNAHERFIRIMPLIPSALNHETINIEGLLLPGEDHGRLSLAITRTDGETIINVQSELVEGYDVVLLTVPGALEVSSSSDKTRSARWKGLPAVRFRPNISITAKFIDR